MMKRIMRKAWEIRKKAAKKFRCKVSEILFSECLRQAWAEARKEKDMREIKGMSLEELKELQSAISEEIAGRETEENSLPIRICVEYPRASGHRRGFLKLITGVNSEHENGYAFEGDFLPDNREIDLPKGSIIIEKEPTGTVRQGSWIWNIYKIGEQGLEEIESYERKNFLSCRDRVTELIKDKG